MRSHAIYDEDLDRATAIGYLSYYEKSKGFIIELSQDLDEWEAPLLFQGLVRQGIYTISNTASLMWVRERIIPSGRQKLSYMVNEGKISPILCGTKSNLYTRGEIDRAMCE